MNFLMNLFSKSHLENSTLNVFGSINCWGDNLHFRDHYPPIYSPQNEFVQLSVGGSSACVLDQSKQVQCWGTMNLHTLE